MADHSSERRWTVWLCSKCGASTGTRPGGECPRFESHRTAVNLVTEVCPVSELEVALRERDHARERLIREQRASDAESEELSRQINELKRRLEEKDKR